MIKLGALGLVLAVIFLCCAGSPIEEKGAGTCHELWANCPGVAEDYKIFSYYNCSLGKRTPTLVIWAECSVEFRY
jgi:hypothetical protein